MPRTPRLFISGKVYEVCFRTEEGLPLVCTPYMKVILQGIIVRAFSMYECELISDMVMPNHLHLHLLVRDPAQVDDAIAYIKRESAHAINNLLGRKQHTVWQAGYDATLVLDFEKMLDRLSYVFLNPVRAGLETTVSLYPGINSYGSVLSDTYVRKGRRVPRESIPKLPSRPLSIQQQNEFAAALLEKAEPEEELPIDVLSFLKAFPEAAHIDRDCVRARLIQRISDEESEIRKRRKGSVVGAHALQLQPITKPHQPKKFGKKMWVLGSTKKIRMRAIAWFKEQFAIRRQLKNEVSAYQYLQMAIPGFFAPGGIIRANLNPGLIPI